MAAPKLADPQALADAYEEVELLLLHEVAASLKSDGDAPDWQLKKLLEVQKLRSKATSAVNATTKDAIQGVRKLLTDRYKDGAEAAHFLTTALDMIPEKELGSGVLEPSKELAALIKEQESGLAASTQHILRSVEDTYRDIIAKASAPALLTGTMTRQDAIQMALNKFADRGITGFTDKSGRNWEMRAYVEMATATASHRASTQGHLEQLAADGLDLVRVSDHRGECERCRPWEGQILSISGKPSGEIAALQAEVEELAAGDPSAFFAAAMKLAQAQKEAGPAYPTVEEARAGGQRIEVAESLLGATVIQRMSA